MKESPIRVLIVDAGCLHRTLSERFRGGEHQVQETDDVAKALELIRVRWPDIVLLDCGLPHANGMELLRRIRELDAGLSVIMATSSPNFREAMEALKAGVSDYLALPCSEDDLRNAIRNVRPGDRRQRERRGANQEGGEDGSLLSLMGSSEKVRRVVAEVAQVAPTKFSVIIVGETGVGKELVAQAIHQQSRQPANRLLSVDCGAISESLIENELFGHERGAFTGADRLGIGKFEAASGGSLFLDEISNLPVGMQTKLLRVLQEKRIYRIGGTAGVQVDVRVIAAANQDLRSLVVANNFREDLFHRLSEYVIQVPPLRERREDILFLAKRFLTSTNQELGKNVRGFSEAAIVLLLTCDWPGNVRELRNVVQRAVLLANEVIAPEHLGLQIPPAPTLVQQNVLGTPGRMLPARVESCDEGQLSLKELVLHNTIQIERTVLLETLQRAGGNKAKAARMLQIDYKTIHTKIRQYGIMKEDQL
jgi:DNA-binding NtrC family response regulator